MKLKVYNFTRHSIDRYYVKDVTSDRFSLFKAQYVQEWNGVVMVYIFQGELRAYRYSFQTRDMLLIARIRTRTIVNLDEMDSHCFLCKDGLLCFGEIIAYYDFSTPAGVALGKYGSQTVCENAFPVSLKGACYRLRLGVYMIYEGRVTFGLFGGNFPEFSFLYPLDAKRVTRIGGRVYGGKPNTVDIIQLDSGHVLDSYEMPQPGVVCAAVSSCDRIYFLWNIYSHALRLNTTNMTIRLFFLGDYFTQCTKVLYLHRKGKLRLPLGLVREICSFIAENKQLAQYLSELVI